MNDENKLQIIVSTSGLEPTEGEVIINKFSDYEAMARDWENKAKSIIVNDEKQVAEMKMAREGRLFLAQKRIAIEKTRKEMKEQSLRKGQAIDAIAKFLTSLIEPTEKYLKEQEDFVEIKKAKEAEARRIEEEARLEQERLAKEEADRIEQERIRQENARLKAEMEEKEKAMAKERAEAEAERKKIEDKARAEREEAERLARLEKEKADKLIADEKAKAEAERLEKERIQKELEAMIECPFCHKTFTKEGK